MGRSGQVFETDGRDSLGGRVVKLFTWAAGLPPEVVQDFTRDAMRVADLRHPHVAQVLDAGTLGDGTPFVVMERLAGMTLDEAVSGRSLPMTEVLPILRGVGSALSAAHAAGVPHGELRADNVFIADLATNGPGCPKLLDFGVARLVTGTHEIGRGAAALGRRAAERADQLALAALGWRLLGAMSAPAIQRVLIRAMSPDPSQRFGSVTALVEALEEASEEASGEASGNAATAGLTMNVGAVSTIVGGTPVSPIRLVRAVVAPPSGPAAARPPTPAPTAALASSPSSLTQQFFAEGEQLEMRHAAQTSDAGAVAERDEEREIETAAASRVPRSRAQMTAAALLALGSVALIGWTVVSLASKPAGGPRAAETAPATVVARPVAVPPAGALRPTRAADRGPGEKMLPARREPGVQPPPFAVPARPPVAASEAPASSRVAAPAPRPAHSPPAEAAPRTGDQAAPLPGVESSGSSDDDEPQPGAQEDGEPHGATPAPSAPQEPVPAPRAWGDVLPAPSAPVAPEPSAPAP